MKLYGVTTTYNNEKMVPYVMKYAEQLGYEKLTVYDNESTDNTVELLKQYPFVEVRTYHTERFCELSKMSVKIDAVFELQKYNDNKDYAWVTTCDFDEVYYFYSGAAGNVNDTSNFHDYLLFLTLLDYNACAENFVHLISHEPYYQENTLLHRQADKIAYQFPFLWNKINLFRLDNLERLYFNPGEHYKEFTFYNQDIKVFRNTKWLFAFHLKFAFGKQALIDMNNMYCERGYQGGQGEEPNTNYSKNNSLNAFDEAYWCGINVQDFFKTKILFGDDSYEANTPKPFY